jgi:hypothetical protein
MCYRYTFGNKLLLQITFTTVGGRDDELFAFRISIFTLLCIYEHKINLMTNKMMMMMWMMIDDDIALRYRKGPLSQRGLMTDTNPIPYRKP